MNRLVNNGLLGFVILLLFVSGGLSQEDQEAIVPDAVVQEEDILSIGDIAPSWALMHAPAQFEFLKNWTVEKGQKLRRFTTQPDRHVVVVSFFATWCKPCMKELPHLENLYQRYKDDKIKFFLVDITEATRNSPGFEDSPVAGPFLAEKGITIQILNDNRGVVKEKYGVSTLPRLFVIDKYQTIQLVKQGYHEGEDFEGELSRVIEELLQVADEG